MYCGTCEPDPHSPKRSRRHAWSTFQHHSELGERWNHSRLHHTHRSTQIRTRFDPESTRPNEQRDPIMSELIHFCVYTNKIITGDICTDCNRFDCAVDFEDNPIQLVTN
jgi:hypothetical protein